jgi:hypothetical protein
MVSPSSGKRIVGTQKNPLEGLGYNVLTIPQAPARRRRIVQAAVYAPDSSHVRGDGQAAESTKSTNKSTRIEFFDEATLPARVPGPD